MSAGSNTASSNSASIFKRTLFDGLIIGYILLSVLIVINNPTEEDMLNLSRNASLFLGLALLGGVISFALNQFFGLATLGEILFATANRRHSRQQSDPLPWYKTFWGAQTGVAFVITLVFASIVTKASLLELLDADSVSHAMRLFHQLVNPSWTILPKAVMKIIETIFIAFMATIIAVPAAFVLSFLCAKNIMGRSKVGFALYFTLRLIFNVSRSIEPVLWAIIFSVWVGIGPFAGMLALMIHSIASLAKQYSEIVESVEDGPIEGIESTGANFIQVIWYAIVPQIVLPHISYTIYRWDINVRMATIIGFVGGGGIGAMLLEYQGQAQWPEVGCIIVVISFVVWSMDTFSAYVREAIK